MTKTILTSLFISISWLCSASDHSNQAYLGASPPGKDPIPFAPEFFSKTLKGNKFTMAFTSDGLECYYSMSSRNAEGPPEQIHYSLYENGAWTSPKRLFPNEVGIHVDPFLSEDESRLYFILARPTEGLERPPVGSSKPPQRPLFDIWYVERQESDWGEPIRVAAPVATEKASEFFVSLTSQQTLYFGSDRADPKNFDLYSAQLDPNGGYQDPKPLPQSVNTSHYEADVFVARDESYIIFCSSEREDGFGRGDLYISFRSQDGEWGEAINMGEKFNSDAHEFAPSISRDGRYFFFNKGWRPHWVDASVIDDLREL